MSPKPITGEICPTTPLSSPTGFLGSFHQNAAVANLYNQLLLFLDNEVNISRSLQYFHPVQCILTHLYYVSGTVGTVQMQCGGASYCEQSGELPYGARPHARQAISQEDLLARVPSCPSCHMQACPYGIMVCLQSTRLSLQPEQGTVSRPCWVCVKDPCCPSLPYHSDIQATDS